MASDNLEMLRALGADPLFIKGTRVDAIAGLVQLMDTAYAAADALPGPLLVLVGEHDEIVPPGAQTAMLERLRAKPCSRWSIPTAGTCCCATCSGGWSGTTSSPGWTARRCRPDEVSRAAEKRPRSQRSWLMPGLICRAAVRTRQCVRSRSFSAAPLQEADDRGHDLARIVVLGREHPADAGIAAAPPHPRAG